MKRKLRKVKYKVTGAFGKESEGEIVAAYLLAEGNGSALIYHPRSKGCCASIEMCKKYYDYYISVVDDTDMYGWINISSKLDLEALIKNLSLLDYKKTTRDNV